ncbi:MAG TPA: hypothetical protein VLF39_02770 [Candidatus Saccharimonadales bacterium]|nr:hypothetical protein [Candidatus Saccharimonadales bacterium]
MMNSKRVYYILVGTLVLLGFGATASVILGNNWLENQTKNLVKLKLDNKILDDQQTALVRANSDITKYADLEKIAKTIVPQDKDQARVVREIVNIANGDGIPIQSISFPSSTLGQSVSSSSSSSSTSSTIPKSSGLSQLKAVTGTTGLYELEITVQSDTNKPVTYPQLINFLSQLEQNRRTAQVNGITVTPNTVNRKLITFSLDINVFIKP